MVYAICKYYLGEDGEIDRYEDLFLMTQKVKAEKKYKEVIREDPDGVYTLERYRVKTMKRGWTAEELLQNEIQNGEGLKCFIEEATKSYPHRLDLSRYRSGEDTRAYFIIMHEKYDRDHRPSPARNGPNPWMALFEECRRRNDG